jgi:hypothetical protein
VEQPKPMKINWFMMFIMLLVLLGGIWAMTLFFQAEGDDPNVEIPPAPPPPAAFEQNK